MEAPRVRTLALEVAGGGTRAVDVARTTSTRIGELDRAPAGLNAFLSHEPETMAADAARLDRELEQVRQAGDAGPSLAGVPVAVKDNLCTLDHPTTCGSRMLESFRPPYEATVVRRLRAAGAIIAGKTNMDEFAMGSSTEHSAFGPTRNPHDHGRVSGGSSGGSAAAVAAGMVPAALGSDTGGSVRQPAAFCGIVGIKPTYGAVSRYGLVAYASSLDQVGVFGRTVEDAALLLQAIAGPDPRDATATDRHCPDLLASMEDGAEGLVVGIPAEYFPETLEPGVRSVMADAIEALARAGAEIRPVSLPTTALAIPSYYVIAPAEAASNLARYDGVRFGSRVDGATARVVHERTRSAGFGAEAKRRILLGNFVLSTGHRERFYQRAEGARSRIAAEFQAAFAAGLDVLFTPTTPEPAFRLGERMNDPYRMYQADVFTVTANLAGLPAVSVPVGTTNGLPVGGQLMAPRWAEPTLLRAAAALERCLAAGPG